MLPTTFKSNTPNFLTPRKNNLSCELREKFWTRELTQTLAENKVTVSVQENAIFLRHIMSFNKSVQLDKRGLDPD